MHATHSGPRISQRVSRRLGESLSRLMKSSVTSELESTLVQTVNQGWGIELASSGISFQRDLGKRVPKLCSA
ncbi:hypothetical protein D3C81_1447880 [compost metagenome]